MARPESIEDLPKYRTEPEEVARIEADHLFRLENVEIMAALFDFLKVAGEHFIVERPSNSSAPYLVRRERTEEELDRILKSEQGSWDRAKVRYDRAIENPAEVEGHDRWLADHHARMEGLEEIDWAEFDRLAEQAERIARNAEADLFPSTEALEVADSE